MKRPLFFLFCLTALFIALMRLNTYSPDDTFPQGTTFRVTLRGRLWSWQEQWGGLSVILRDCEITCQDESYSCERLNVTISSALTADLLTRENLDSTDDLHAGYEFLVSGTLTSIQPARNPGNFDWRLYYQARHISYQAKAVTLTVSGHETYAFQDLILRVKHCLTSQLESLTEKAASLPGVLPQSCSLLKALLLGDRSELDDETEDLYENAGILHILSVSGLHVSLLGGAVLSLSRVLPLPDRLRSLPACVLIFLYWQLCGAGISSGRAALMFVCMCAAPMLGRTYDTLSALSLAGILFLLDSPLMLYQSSFQLSFAAILGICLVCPAFVPESRNFAQASTALSSSGLRSDSKADPQSGLRSDSQSVLQSGLCTDIHSGSQSRPQTVFQTDLQSRSQSDTEHDSESGARILADSHHFVGILKQLWGKIRPTLCFSLGLQLTLLPVTLWHFFQYPLYSILINLLVLPLTPCLFICAAAALLLAFLSIPAAAIVLYPSMLILRLYDLLCHIFISFPFSDILAGRPSLWRIIMYYTVLALFCLYRHYRKSHCIKALRRVNQAVAYPLIICVLITVLAVRLPSSSLTVTFLDVGQGDCAFLRTSRGTTILIDAGSTDLSSVTQNRLLPFLESQGIGSLDYVFISHSDADHVNAITGYLESGRSIGTVLIPLLDGALASESSYTGLLKTLNDYNVSVIWMNSGQIWQEGELSLQCLAPASASDADYHSYSSLNAASQVLLLTWQGFRILFTGDCGEDGELLLIRELKKQGIICDLLKAGHHGSATSTSTELLTLLSPKAVVISCGIENSYGHPSPEMTARLEALGIPYYVTAEVGAITVTIRRGQATLTSMLSP